MAALGLLHTGFQLVQPGLVGRLGLQVVAQTLTGLGLLIGAAQLFVSSVEHLAHGHGADELNQSGHI